MVEWIEKNSWMVGWTGKIDGCGRMDRKKYEKNSQMVGWTGKIEGWLDGQKKWRDGWLDKQQMDGWMDRKDRWMVECIVKKMDKNGLLDGQKKIDG